MQEEQLHQYRFHVSGEHFLLVHSYDHEQFGACAGVVEVFEVEFFEDTQVDFRESI